MAHMIEATDTMFSVRERPWHGLGIIIDDAPTSEDALRLAGLDWNVVQRPVFVDGVQAQNYYANVRDRDNSILGIVSGRYKIVQNKEAFSFTDNLIGEDVRYETAGSLKNGKTIWMLARMPKTTILGDEVEPYMCFTNSHDGTGAIKVCMTPIRVVCNNTLNIALNKASRSWSTKHMGDMNSKLLEAERTLGLANNYMEELAKTSDRLANSTLTNDEIRDFFTTLVPTNDDASDLQKQRAQQTRDAIYSCYVAPDIAKFIGTKYGLINAVADYVDHSIPNRLTKDYRENNWGRIIDGHPMLDKAVELLGVGA